MKPKKPIKGKVIPELSGNDRMLMFQKVNQAPAGQGINETERRKRESLYSKLIEGAVHDIDKGTEFDFEVLAGDDLILTNAEWNALKVCFESGASANMFQAQICKKLLEVISNAGDCDVPEKVPQEVKAIS